MDQGELETWVKTENLKFDYTFTTLIFVTLGLSIQFSPGMGKEWQWLLIASWITLFLAGFAGGYRLARLQYFIQIDATRAVHIKNGNVQGVEKGDQLLDREQPALKTLLYIRFWVFSAGVCMNLIFAIINYLHKV